MSLEVIKTIILQKEFPTIQNNITSFKQDIIQEKQVKLEQVKPKSRCNQCNCKINITLV